MVQYCVSPSRALGVVCPALRTLVLACHPPWPPRKFPQASVPIPWSCILPFDVVHAYAFCPRHCRTSACFPTPAAWCPALSPHIGHPRALRCADSVPPIGSLACSLHVAHALAVRHHCAVRPHPCRTLIVSPAHIRCMVPLFTACHFPVPAYTLRQRTPAPALAPRVVLRTPCYTRSCCAVPCPPSPLVFGAWWHAAVPSTPTCTPFLFDGNPPRLLSSHLPAPQHTLAGHLSAIFSCYIHTSSWQCNI
ncbi:hypothetical protein B0H14DRAFT_3489844 [Mycena olivaceomarginata]|nr:hypothetical protein B0H14DRAFT_3489844 [Mycena olivaceomarginata]